MRYFPVNWAKIQLIDQIKGSIIDTTLSELIDEKGYERCSKIFRDEDKQFIVKVVKG